MKLSQVDFTPTQNRRLVIHMVFNDVDDSHKATTIMEAALIFCRSVFSVVKDEVHTGHDFNK